MWQIGREHEVRSQKSIAADSTGGGVPGARCQVPGPPQSGRIAEEEHGGWELLQDRPIWLMKLRRWVLDGWIAHRCWRRGTLGGLVWTLCAQPDVPLALDGALEPVMLCIGPFRNFLSPFAYLWV